MDQIKAADIRDITDGKIARDEARDIAKTCQQLCKHHKVNVWELSMENRQLFLEGWDKDGFEVCHEFILAI